MGNSLLAVRDINHKYIVVEKRTEENLKDKEYKTTKWKKGQGYFLRELSRTMQALKRSMENEKEKSLNMKVYYEDERKVNQRNIYEVE